MMRTSVRIRLFLAVMAALAGNVQSQTYTGLFREFYLNLEGLEKGFGMDGRDILLSALGDFSPTFVTGWTDCINSQQGMSLGSMTEPVWTIYTWTTGDTSVLPLPYQYPNGDGFVQQTKWKVETMSVSGGLIDDALRDECTRQAFSIDAFLPFLEATDTGGMFATATGASAIAMDDFTPQSELTTITGEGKISLEFDGTDTKYGPTTGADSVISALNGPGFYPIVSEAWRQGIEENVDGSRVYAIEHYYTEARTFLYGQYFVSGGVPGNLVDQTVTDKPSVITEYTYAFRARWWKPNGFEGDLAGTDEMAVGAFDNSDFTPFLKEADTGNHFTGVTQVIADTVDENPPPEGCALDVSMSCTLNGTDMNCNDIPIPDENCDVPIKYRYYFKNNGPADAKLVSAIRTRDGEERRYLENREGQTLGVGFVLDTWEMIFVNMCEASTSQTNFEVKTAVDGGLDCSENVEYELVIDPNFAPTPAPVCDLRLSVSCATTNGVECNEVAEPTEGFCAVQVEYQYTVRNAGSAAATFSTLNRTRANTDDLDLLPYFDDPFVLGVPPQSNSATLKETAYINFCQPGAYTTNLVAEAGSGTNVCNEQAEYTLMSPAEPGNQPQSASDEGEPMESSDPAIAVVPDNTEGGLVDTSADDIEPTVTEDDASTQPPTDDKEPTVTESDASTQPPTTAPTEKETEEPTASPSSASIGAHFAGGIISFVGCLFFAI